MSSSTSTSPGWLSRLVLGKRVKEGEQAKREFQKALNGHRFDPEQMREQLDGILIEVEQKAQALSIRPPPTTEQETEDEQQRRKHDAGHRETKAGAG
jgi:hypothetical protein